MFSDPIKTKFKRKKIARFGGIFLGCVYMFCFGVGFAVDADNDGLDSSVDNTDSIAIFTPHITSPTERQGVIDDDLEATFSGNGEVNTQIRVFEDETPLCTANVNGNGISIGSGVSAIIDSTTLVTGEILAQFFYDTTTDSASTTWRTNTRKSWYTEAGSSFPVQSILIATSDTFYIFDAQTRTEWDTFSESGITSFFALNGSLYLGKSTGFKIYDLVNDDFTETLTTTSTPAIINNSVIDLAGKTINSEDYIVIGTEGGTTIYNAVDESVVAKSTDSVVALSVGTDDKLRYTLGATTFVSDQTIDNLESSWDVTDISAGVNFGSGVGTTADGDFIGHTKGLTYVQSELRDIETGLIYKETFDSLVDITTNAYATATITDVSIVSGRNSSDSAFDFNGTTSKVTTALTSNADFQNGFTISAWIYPESEGEDGFGRIVDKSEGASTTSTNGFSLRWGVGGEYVGLLFAVNNGDSRYTILDESIYNTWSHLLVTVSSEGVPTFYIDGVLSPLTNPGSVGSLAGITTNNPLVIGNQATSANTFDGAISDVKIYDRVLTSTEIGNLYAGGESAYSYRYISKDYVTSDLTGNEKGYWFNSITDRSGSGNNLTNNNSVAISEIASGADLQQFTFNGTSNYLNSSSTDFNITGNSLTVGMWVKRPDTGGTGAYAQILTHGESRNTRSYFLSAGDEFFDYPLAYDPYFFGVRTTNGFKATSIQTNPVADTWEFIVGTYDGTNVRIYRNGILEDVNPHTGTIMDVEEDLRIGWGYEDEYFNGNVALPFVSTVSYTAEQILDMYNFTINWFDEDSTLLLSGVEEEIADISSHPGRNLVYIGKIDRLDKLSTATGFNSQISTGTVSNIAVTHLGTWQCTATLPQSSHTVFAKAFIGANASDIVSENRTFFLYQPSENDTDGDGLENDSDNDPFAVIATPTIDTIINTSGMTYSFSGTGDATTYESAPTKVGLFMDGQDTALFFADVGSDGNWSETYTFSVGNYTLYARAYYETYASNISSEQVTLAIETADTGAPTVNALSTYTGNSQVNFSWNSNIEGAQFYAELSTSEDFSVIAQNSGWINDTSYVFQGLADAQKYYFRVKLRDSAGTESSFSDSTFTTIDTSVPTDGMIANEGNYSNSLNVSFSWGGFADNNGSGIDHYEIDIAVDNGFSNIVFSNDHYVDNSKTFEGVFGNTYYARLKAVDGVGNTSNWVYSGGITIDTTVPTAFTLNTITTPTSPGDKILSWTASTDDESGIRYYQVYREDRAYDDQRILSILEASMRLIGTSTTLNYVDTTIEDGKVYTYKITAVNWAGGETESNQIQFWVEAEDSVPPQFENIQQFFTTDSVTIDWTVATNLNDISAYEVLRDGNLIYTTPDANTTTYVDTEAKTDGQIYSYVVRARNTEGATGIGSNGLQILVDKTSPTTSEELTGTQGGSSWYRTPVIVSLSAVDTGTTIFTPQSSAGTGFYSGVNQIFYNKNEVGVAQYSAPVTVGTNGTNTFVFYTTDKAGNQEDSQSISIKVDTTAPTVSLSTDLDLSTNNGFVSADSVDFTSVGTDSHSGIASIVTYVQFDQNGDGSLSGANDFDFTQISTSATSPDTDTYNFTRDGKYIFKVVATDVAGNSTTSSLVTIKVDRIAPVTTNNAPTSVPASLPFTITLVPSDAPVSSGIYRTYYTTDGTTPTTNSLYGTTISSDDITFIGDYYTVKYFTVDALGNEEAIKTATNNPVDTDADGMPDFFELAYTDPSSAVSLTPTGDEDSDNLTNLQEYQNNTDPTNSDSDGDEIDDETEVSDGTDPNKVSDHRVIVLAPVTLGQTTNTPFAFLAKAPKGKTVSIKNSGGTVIATGVSDASGRVAIELSLALGTTHTLSTEFLHTNGQLVRTPNISINVQGNSIDNPSFSNLVEEQLFSQDLLNLEIAGQENSTMEIFQIENGNVTSLAVGMTNGSGEASITLPNTFLGGTIFIVDQTNSLTSKMLTVERGVYVSGQIFDENNLPLEGMIVKFIDGSREYDTMTNVNGEYFLTVRGDTEYLVKIYHRYYLKDERTVEVARTDVRISAILVQIEEYNLQQTEDGVVQVDGSGETGYHQAGMNRYDILKIAESGYKKALEVVQELNKGTLGKVLTMQNDSGEDVFLGYKSGRLGVDEFKVQPHVAQRMTGLLTSERKATSSDEGALSSLKEGVVCLSQSDTIANFSDVPVRHSYAGDIAVMNSYGIVVSDDDNKFYPDKSIGWGEVFQSVLEGSCTSVQNFILLSREDLPELKDFPLENTVEGIIVYTALQKGFIDADFDVFSVPTRQEVITVLARALELEINEKAKNSSFMDVLETDPMAPILIAAKGAGWFKNFNEERFFYHNKEVTRGEFSTWFVNAIKHRLSQVTAESTFQKLMKKLRGEETQENARLGTRETSVSDVESHLTGRRYNEEKEPYFVPTRASWNPVDTTSGRAPIKIEDKSENIHQDIIRRPGVLQSLEGGGTKTIEQDVEQ